MSDTPPSLSRMGVPGSEGSGKIVGSGWSGTFVLSLGDGDVSIVDSLEDSLVGDRAGSFTL